MAYKNKVITLLGQAKASAPLGTSAPKLTNSILSLGRQLGAYVMAADYIGYRDPAFVSWVSAIRAQDYGGHSRWYTLTRTATNSANNWGTFALASLTVADAYLQDQGGLARDWLLWKSYGDINGNDFETTSDFKQRGAGWVCAPLTYSGDANLPIAIGQATCTDNRKEGAALEDAARTTFPTVGNYPAEAAQGYVLTAEVLQKQGYDAWNVNSKQACRNAAWRQRMGNLNFSNADHYVNWVINKRCGFTQPTQPAGYGRVWGFTDWLYS